MLNYSLSVQLRESVDLHWTVRSPQDLINRRILQTMIFGTPFFSDWVKSRMLMPI